MLRRWLSLGTAGAAGSLWLSAAHVTAFSETEPIGADADLRATTEREVARGSLADLDLDRDAEAIIADARCPSCLREALKGPCGGRFLLMFKCQDGASDDDINGGICDEQWSSFSQCFQDNVEYYDNRRREWAAEDARDAATDADQHDGNDQGSLPAA